MILKKLLLTILLLGSGFGFSIMAQSSIYQDAKALAEIARSGAAPVLRFKKMRTHYTSNGIFQYDFKRGNIKIDVAVERNERIPRYALPSFGIFKFTLNPGDTLEVAMPDSLLSFGGPSYELVEVDYNSDLIRIFTTTRPELILNGVQNDSVNLDPLPARQLRYETKVNFQEIMKIVQAHSHYRIKNENKIPTYESNLSKYRENPFFGELIERNEFPLPSTDKYFKSNMTLRRYESTNDFFNYLNKNYEWHQLLYGDTTIQLQKKVSYKDIAGNYRTPIVTSKKELIEANTKINETSRNRNFLDAQTVAVGLSDFIAERAQEELNLTFFTRFKENLSDPSELTVLFPETKNLLYQFEISNYKTLLSNAREAFTVDLDNLGLNFPNILELPKYRSLYNSPEVYNVSLIYSIANMAYKEIPVEDIMMVGFQKLRNRDLNLSKDINLTLADAILHPTAFPKKEGKKDKDAFQPKIKPGTEIAILEQHLNDYLSSIDKTRAGINQAFESISYANSYLLEKGGIVLPSFSVELDMDISAFKEETISPIFLDPTDYDNFVTASMSKTGDESREFSRSVFGPYNKLFIHNREVAFQGNFIHKYRDILKANLHGKAYFQDLLDQPTLEDYEAFLKDRPDQDDRVLARGLAISRNLLNENWEDYLEKKIATQIDMMKDILAFEEVILYRDLGRDAAERQMSSFLKRVDLVKGAAEEEIYFWSNALGKDISDHQIFALHHLKGVIDNNLFIKTFQQAQSELQEAQRSQTPFYVKDFVSEKIPGGNYELILKKADEELVAIKDHMIEKVVQLYDTNKSASIDNRVYAKKLKFFDHYLTKQSQLNNVSELVEKAAEDRRLIDESIRTKINEDADLQGLIADLNTLTDSLENGSFDENDPAVFDKLVLQYDSLQSRQSEIEASYQEQNQALIADLELNLKNQLEGMAQNQTSDSMFYAIPPSIDGSTLTLLSEAYSFNDNKFYVAYIQEESREESIEGSKNPELAEIERNLSSLKDNLQNARKKRALIQTHFKILENDYCKNLVDAKTNAKNLAKSFEVAIHLLYAFRDYKGVDSTLMYNDTTNLMITNNQIDSTTGYVTSMTVIDTFRVNKKRIIESDKATNRTRWITRQEFKSLQSDEIEWNLFLGLLYERLNAIEDLPNRFTSEGVALLATKFLEITHDMETHRTNLRIKKATEPDRVSFKDYYPFIRTTVDMFNTVIRTQSIGDKNLMETLPSLTAVPEISDQALSLYENIYAKEYSGAILNAMELLKVITTGKLEEKERLQSTRAINAVFTYGTFMANMIDAKSSEQVKNILKSVTLPPGSSRIKRETTNSFTINSYLGASVARDVLVDAPNGVDASSFGAALSVPIGFTYSFSPNWIKNSSSLSLFVPLLDLGAITAYRQDPKQDEYSVDALPELKWRNLFSPGLFAVYNFANNPFSLGVGGQYGPQLREIKFETGDPVSVNSFRFPMVFFNIDVPFFNLHTGPKKIIVR